MRPACFKRNRLYGRYSRDARLARLPPRHSYLADRTDGVKRLLQRGTTCVRDYGHIRDLCAAHLAAMERLSGGSAGFEAFNLGTGTGYSVKEVIETCRRVTGQDIRYRISGRRPGDPTRLVASAERASAELGWSPEFTELAAIVETAWRWFARPSH